jgi:hypothetical protein
MIAAGLVILCVSGTAIAAPRLASHYAPMFDKGRTWTYELSVTDFDYVEKPNGSMHAVKMKPRRSSFRCSVTNVVTFPEAVVATIHCDTEIDSNYGFRADGMWVATKDGVFRAGGDEDALPASAKDISFAPPLIRANPKAARAKRKTDYGGVVVEAVTNPAKGTWCTTADTTQYGAGDGAITTECFQAGVGLASGVFDYHGGTPRIVEYRLAAK